jgi:uncharacterized protein
MFGLSLMKILFTLAAIVIVWQGFRLFRRREAARLERDRRRPVETERRTDARSTPVEGSVEETQPCPVCGAYVPVRGATPCGRSDCPYPG